ncbi:hypothetical protein [Bradyrhizobium sp.]|uniref:hypothetical protein n=1 Tax=Bradyrhizobium sp. TaxID=376 RepID=UPI0023A49FBB|nr:hypothetical protein [Bradyrhizobium sp.]MDE2376904.1 hypothetical protein [Bradyrhizobium sp.]
MNAELSRIARPRIAKLWLPVALVVGGGLWLLMSDSEGNVAQSEPLRSEMAAVQSEPAAAPEAPTATAQAPEGAAELDRMRISSQSWRRGGLGSKALVSFTLRNDNEYAVRDIEIACVFDRRDGSHLTDRHRLLPDTVNTMSRKTFAHVAVGFVNVNAGQAKCKVIAARRA